jgi:mannose-6-phosphate isomerase-like protein (cupin superfamily)
MLPVDSATPERLRLGGDDVTILASSAQTRGALFAVRLRMPPGGGPPLMHRHAAGELYNVLEGEFAFYVATPDGVVHRSTAGAGDVVPLAGGTPHTIRNESDADAVALVVHAPGEAVEGFVRAAAALAARGDAGMDTALRVAAEHGIEMLGPVGGTAQAETAA